MENRAVLIDTSLFIDYFRKTVKSRTKLFQLVENGYNLITSSICYFEYMVGSKNQDFDKQLFEYVEIVPFDAHQAIIAANIHHTLKSENTLIEFRDILIASAALSEEIPLATLNVKHFERIDALNIYPF